MLFVEHSSWLCYLTADVYYSHFVIGMWYLCYFIVGC